MKLRYIPSKEVNDVLNFKDLIDCLRHAFCSKIVFPIRHHHSIDHGPDGNSTLLIMPAWSDSSVPVNSNENNIGIKLVTVFPNNQKLQKPSIMGSYLLLSGMTGEPLAIIDGQSLTLWRTAAASALAGGYLARSDSKKMLMVGSGALAPYLIRAHSSIRPITEVTVWNRTHSKAVKLAEILNLEGISTNATQDIKSAAMEADIISCATMSTEPLIKGDWLRSGTHIDLVGAFSKDMRECDDTAIKMSAVFVDTREGALSEGGDITQPIDDGIVDEDHIRADLFELCQNKSKGRKTDDDITLFKSVGAALEDFAIAQLIYSLTVDSIS